MRAREIALKGETALVTGGSRGIGKAIVEFLLDEGMEVWATSRNWEACGPTRQDFLGISESFRLVDCNSGNVGEINKLYRKLKSPLFRYNFPNTS